MGVGHRAGGVYGGREAASGRRRRGVVKKERKLWSRNSIKGQILIPGTDSDFIITFYKRTDNSPALFDRGVHEVEKN